MKNYKKHVTCFQREHVANFVVNAAFTKAAPRMNFSRTQTLTPSTRLDRKYPLSNLLFTYETRSRAKVSLVEPPVAMEEWNLSSCSKRWFFPAVKSRKNFTYCGTSCCHCKQILMFSNFARAKMGSNELLDRDLIFTKAGHSNSEQTPQQ